MTSIRTSVAVALTAATALVVAGSAAPPEADAAKRCREAGSKTIVTSKQARVYRSKQRGRLVYGCLYRRGVRVALTETYGRNNYSESSLAGPDPVLAGRFVAYAYDWSGAESGGSGVAVVDLGRGGKSRGIELDSGYDDSHPEVSVKDIVVTSRGATAWTWLATYANDPAKKDVREVRKLGLRDSQKGFGALLDSGPDVDVGSLELAGSAASWVKAGQRVSASLR